MRFDEFALNADIISTLHDMGFDTPTPIQEQTIGSALKGLDILGIAQTGTGKTAAFLLPLLTLMTGARAKARMPRCIILEPTRELASQVEDACREFSKNLRLETALLIGGVSSKAQEVGLDRGVDILIATPGRFLDQYERGKLLLSDVQHLVIDEADRMLDMGFIPDIEKICSITPFTKQTMLFSATMPDDIGRIAEKFMSAPVRVEVSPENTTNRNVAQNLVFIAEKKKRELLRAVLKTVNPDNTIIFCNSKRGVGVLNDSLLRHGFGCAAIHGDISQHIRTHVLNQFREQKMRILVASDVAARGIDVPHVSHVINFDVPSHAEDYIHRIGRTGRGGRTGIAITFVDKNDSKQMKYLEAVQKLIDENIPQKEVSEFGFSLEEERKNSKIVKMTPQKSSDSFEKKESFKYPPRRGKRDAIGVMTLENDPQSFADLDELPSFLQRPTQRTVKQA